MTNSAVGLPLGSRKISQSNRSSRRWRLSQDVHTPAVIGFALQEIDALRIDLLLSRRTPAGVLAYGRTRRQTGTRGPPIRPLERCFRRSRRVPVPSPIPGIARASRANHRNARLCRHWTAPVWRRLGSSHAPFQWRARAPRPTLEATACAPERSLLRSPLGGPGHDAPASARGSLSAAGRACVSAHRLSRQPVATAGRPRTSRFCLNSVCHRGGCK